MGSGEHWTVYGLCDEQRCCRIVQEFSKLGDIDSQQAMKMMRLLRGQAVNGNLGPQDLSCYASVHLDDDIYEFKRGPKTGGGIRVLFFYPKDRPKSVICTHSFIKRSQKTPRGKIDTAKACRSTYYTATEAGRVIVLKSLIPQFPQGVN